LFRDSLQTILGYLDTEETAPREPPPAGKKH
jgi:hypothetical protein